MKKAKLKKKVKRLEMILKVEQAENELLVQERDTARRRVDMLLDGQVEDAVPIRVIESELPVAPTG